MVSFRFDGRITSHLALSTLHLEMKSKPKFWRKPNGIAEVHFKCCLISNIDQLELIKQKGNSGRKKKIGGNSFACGHQPKKCRNISKVNQIQKVKQCIESVLIDERVLLKVISKQNKNPLNEDVAGNFASNFVSRRANDVVFVKNAFISSCKTLEWRISFHSKILHQNQW